MSRRTFDFLTGLSISRVDRRAIPRVLGAFGSEWEVSDSDSEVSMGRVDLLATPRVLGAFSSDSEASDSDPVVSVSSCLEVFVLLCSTAFESLCLELSMSFAFER